MKTIKELFVDISSAVIYGENCEVKSLCTDSRRILPGALFFAFKGVRCAGKNFELDAVRRGAIAVVSDGFNRDLPENIAQIIVPDVHKVVVFVAQRFYGALFEDFSLIGITGTNGKTSVSSIVRFLLQKQSPHLWGLIGTVSYELGSRVIPSYKTTPEALDLMALFSEMKNESCVGAVMEVSSHAIDQDRVFGMPFQVVAFTNLTQDHIDYHKTIDAYFAVKKRLFNGELGYLPKFAILNKDDKYIQTLFPEMSKDVSVLSFGLKTNLNDAGVDFLADNISLSSGQSSFDLITKDGRYFVETHLPGTYNISNVLCALAIVFAMGGDLKVAIENLKSFYGVPGRMERVISKPFKFDIFVDYAHTDDALKNVLQMLRPIVKGRVLVVFGCGGNRDRGKRPKMTKIVQEYSDYAWATSDNPRKEDLNQIFDDMKAGVFLPEKIEFVRDRRHAIGKAIADAKEGDCVLIAGKGHETYQEFDEITLSFDDREVAREFVQLKCSREGI